ncbi:MAG: thiamine-phosphate kinase [Verrucomicrobiota bacterium]|jgi:thiamine-monophosphate kinase
MNIRSPARPLRSEEDFLSRLFPMLGRDRSLVVPPGDDCAVFRGGSGTLLVAGVDQVILGKHYLAGEKPARAGRKLLARNLSDIAAMGATPRWALLASATGPELGGDWLMDFHQGLLAHAGEHQVMLIGGDLASLETGAVHSLTIIGEVEEGRIMTRASARPGDLLYATGSFGLSFPSGHHLDFKPRLQEGAWLASFGIKACMDVTDGLLRDLRRVCLASGQLDLRLELEKIPRRAWQGCSASEREALCDGEDYELIFAVPPELAEGLEKTWPFATPLSRIGRFLPPGRARIDDGRGTDLIALHGLGYDHFESAKP